jgi:hypothetical protein
MPSALPSQWLRLSRQELFGASILSGRLVWQICVLMIKIRLDLDQNTFIAQCAKNSVIDSIMCGIATFWLMFVCEYV